MVAILNFRLYKMFVFGTDWKSNMAARAHNVFWLVEILNIFLLETTKPIELRLCRNENWVVNLVQDHPMIIPAKSQFNWLSGF
jgi:hypothetical protein